MSDVDDQATDTAELVGVAMAVDFGGGRVVKRGAYEIGSEQLTEDEAEAILEQPRWGRKIEAREVAMFGGLVGADGVVGNNFPFPPAQPLGDGGDQTEDDPDGSTDITLDMADNVLSAALSGLNKADMDAFWASQDPDAMATFLVERADRERKDGWTVGAMGNMIQKHLGVEEPAE